MMFADWLHETGYYDDEGGFFGGDPNGDLVRPEPSTPPEERTRQMQVWLTKFAVIGAVVVTLISVVLALFVENDAVQASLTALMSMLSAIAGAATAFWFTQKGSP
jgi:hypothetical protein